jgi:hypothetical protein
MFRRSHRRVFDEVVKMSIVGTTLSWLLIYDVQNTPIGGTYAQAVVAIWQRNVPSCSLANRVKRCCGVTKYILGVAREASGIANEAIVAQRNTSPKERTGTQKIRARSNVTPLNSIGRRWSSRHTSRTPG